MKLSTLSYSLISAGFANGLVVHPRDNREPNPESAGVADCLGDKDVPVLWPADSKYDDYAEPFNLRLQYKPAVIVLPTTARHVQDAVICASQNDLTVQARSGGHSYASFSSGGKDGAMVINLEPMQDVELDTTTNIAKVGGGNRLGNLAQAIYDQGKRALPHGTCAGVGVGGHFTHGGYGHTSRHWGIALDTIVGADVVLANGTLVRATKTEYPSVFWAIRGAADSIGVIVNFYLQTQPAPESVTYFSFEWPNLFDGSRQDFINHFKHFQDFAQNASVVDDRISFGINTNSSRFNLGGTFMGSVEDFQTKIQPEFLRGVKKPDTIKVEKYEWIPYLILMDGEGIVIPETGYDKHDNFFAKSITVPETNGLSAESLGAWYDNAKNSPTQYFIITNLYGGPGSHINDKATDFAAYSERDSLWVMQLYGFKENDGNAAVPFINNLVDVITAAAPDTEFGAYLNYLDPSLSASEAHELYYGQELYKQLLDVKKQVDPKGVFWNPQAIGVEN